MISIISGTGNPSSRTFKVAQACRSILNDKGLETQLVELSNLPSVFYSTAALDKSKHTDEVKLIHEQSILNAEKTLFIAPEYNGSIPGVLKHFIDVLSVRDGMGGFKGSTFGLIGIASGRAGNLRGLDHLASILQHLGGLVMPGYQPIAGIFKQVQLDDAPITDDELLLLLTSYIDRFIEF